MFLNIVLLLSSASSAALPADKPLVLKPLHSFLVHRSAAATDPDFTVIATPTESAVNVWSLETGRQIGRYELPEIPSAAVHIRSVRPDLKMMLLSTSHLYPTKGWKDGDKTPRISRGVVKLYLASLEDGKPPKEIYAVDAPCFTRIGVIDWQCAEFYSPYIHPERAEVIAKGYRPRGTGHGRIFNLAFNLTGKRLPASAEPPLSVESDAQSCGVMRGDKRVSFLDGCSKADWPDLDQKTVSSCTKGTFKAWDTETGALKTRIETPSPKGWYALDSRACSQSSDGRIVSVIHRKPENTEARVEIWSAASGKILAVGSGPDFAGIESFKLSPDGRRALYSKNERMVFADLGLEDAPEAPMLSAAPKLDVDKLPPASSKPDPDAFAVVIGVEKYRQAGIPAVDYASRDAKTMAAYLGSMGFDAKNVAVLTDAQAGKVDFDKHFGSWLKNRVGPKSRVFVYYAGHGAPNPTTGAGYLMPYEADPSYLEETAYPVARLYAELAKLPTKDVTIVLDACFSGQGERSLIAKGTRPLVAVQKTRAPENAAVIAAASGSQISASDHEARHGLLTYHLLAGLHGGADADEDGKITTSELFSYAQPAVERAAKLQNVEQTPTVSGAAGAAGARVWTTLKKP